MCDIGLDKIKLQKINDKLPGSYILYENDEGNCLPFYALNYGKERLHYEEDKDKTSLKAI